MKKYTAQQVENRIKIALISATLFFILFISFDQLDPYVSTNETISGIVRDIPCGLPSRYGYPVCNIIIDLENGEKLVDTVYYKPSYSTGTKLTFSVKRRKYSGLVEYINK